MNQKISKLSELPRDMSNALQHRYSMHKRLWRSQLLEDFATGRDQRSPELRRLRNSRLEWLQTVTTADFELPIVVHYGTIKCEANAKDFLAAQGVEVGSYDHKKGAFHVRVNAEALEAIKAHSADFPLDQLHQYDDRVDQGFPRDLTTVDDSYLKGANAFFTYRIRSDENDGRMTAGSSADLDYCMERVKKLEGEIARRSSPSNAPSVDSQRSALAAAPAP